MSNLQDSFRALTTDSILVSQKELILGDLVNAIYSLEKSETFNQGIDEVETILYTLSIVKDLWIANSYGYKLRELLNRILDALQAIQLPVQAKAKERLVRKTWKRASEMMPPAELDIL